MKQIKVLGVLIFTLSITLTFIFNHTSKKNSIHHKLLETIKEQKAFTQDISKNIFYIYRNNNKDTKALNDSIKNYLNYMNNKDQELYRSTNIIKLWNNFYLHVQHFRNQIKVKSPYSNLLLKEEVKYIYTTNLKLILEFNKLIKTEQDHFNQNQNLFMTVQYLLFGTLFLLLLYLFTQLKSLITFIQEFLFKSKKILKNSSIKELQPIVSDDNYNDIKNAKNNFNALVLKINNSINNSTKSIEYSQKSLETLETDVDELLDFIYDMNNSSDDELRKKEDAIIQSLEELSSTKLKLNNLKTDLNNLISHS